MEPVSAFAWLCSSNDPQIQLQSDCFSLPLSLRGNSEEWDCCGSAPAVCLSAERRGGDEERKERGKGGGALCGLSLTFQSLPPNSLFFFPRFLAIVLQKFEFLQVLLLAPGAAVAFAVIGSLSPHLQHLSNTNATSTSSASPTCQSSKTF